LQAARRSGQFFLASSSGVAANLRATLIDHKRIHREIASLRARAETVATMEKPSKKAEIPGCERPGDLADSFGRIGEGFALRMDHPWTSR
jgi:hypothetical protein